jgi:polyhydroxyalkanoate synthase
MNNVVIVSATRTAVGKFGGSLINILAKYDHIVPLAAGKALKDVYSGKSYEEIVFPSSHIGLSMSREAHLNLWPKVREWVVRTE